MGSLMQDLKKQASFFMREKIKTARLVLTDVTPVQILAEDITNGESMAADVQAMRLISKAAFEVDDYERIVQILHHRLSKFDTRNWQASYKALILLEYLLTHGPQRIAEEFECDQDVIRDMANFHYLDHNGFDWGSHMKKKSDRVIDLLEDQPYLKEERARARKLTFGIKGFGSINQRSSSSGDGKDNAMCDKIMFRSKTHQYITEYSRHAEENDLMKRDENATSLLPTNNIAKNYTNHWSHGDELGAETDHPFWDKENHSRVSLLSSV